MAYSPTTALRKIAALKAKIRAVQGGTSASKTISILMILIHLAQADESPTLTSVISESVPHLKRGAMRDFKNIMRVQGYWRDDRWNATDSIYTFETGSQIEFFSADDPDKLRGGRRDRAFLNEANNVSLDAFDQIEVRTRQFVYLDWNPTTEFWFYTEILGKRDDVEHIIVTYKDNEALDAGTISSIEQRRDRKAWWQVYAEGQLGEVEGRIYTGWKILPDVPDAARLKARGLDFGYTNDPSALIDIYAWNSGYIWDEVFYQKGASNRTIANVILALEGQVPTIADSSEPKSIDELRLYGVQIIPAAKGSGSVNQGIQLVQDRPHWVTRRSVNLLREYRNHLWLTDREGKRLNAPQDWDNHALDAGRYGEQFLNPVEKERPRHEYVPDKPLFDEIGL